MHHSSERDEEMNRRMNQIPEPLPQLGATGNFPQGKLTEHDEGEIRLAVGVSGGKVVINFGKPTAWIGMDAKQARQLAESLRQHSYKVK